MKTVMKKMFCLMLVAVLLVGVMPFHAFATEGEGEPAPQSTTYEITFLDGDTPLITVTTNDSGKIDDTSAIKPLIAGRHINGWTYNGVTEHSVKSFTFDNDAMLYASHYPQCECGIYEDDTTATHTDKDCDLWICSECSLNDCICCPSCDGTINAHVDCITQCTGGLDCPNSTSHNDTCLKLCKNGDNCTSKNHVETCTSGCNKQPNCESQWDYGHKDGCESQNVCETCGETGHFAKNCPETICPDCGAAVANKKHEPGCIELCNGKRDCPNQNVDGGHHKTDCDYALCDIKGCELNEGHSGVHKGAPCTDENCDYSLGHSGKHSYQCPEDGCDKAVGHDGKHSNEPNYASGSHKLKVYARIWVHETKFETRLLDTITGLSGDAKIYQVIAANKDHLNAILPYDEFKALHWGETVNYLNDDKEYKDVGTRMTVSDENEVYVNLYSAEQLIVVNVHTSKTWAYDISVRIEGFRPGDLVTYEDVLKAVKKYYNVSSMKMFTYEEMCDYLDGGKADQIENFIAGEKDDPYEVFISGSRKSGAYKYTADSTNPKTGDEIFVPMAVLGLSASALAVMFYLNKKRAY